MFLFHFEKISSQISWVIHLKLKELSKITFNFLPVSLFHSLSLTFFFFKDFSSKFVWHKNFEGVPDFAWGCSYFFFKGKQIKKFKLLYIYIFFFSGQGVPPKWHRHWRWGLKAINKEIKGIFEEGNFTERTYLTNKEFGMLPLMKMLRAPT